uniref:Uncharacterized protein n=1 Tax=Romanomermis culicivorax TaxID=13658 RepID=A0A915KNI6_ROMCU
MPRQDGPTTHPLTVFMDRVLSTSRTPRIIAPILTCMHPKQQWYLGSISGFRVMGGATTTVFKLLFAACAIVTKDN